MEKQKMLDGTDVPVGAHRDDIVVCSDGTEVARHAAILDCAGNAHSSDEARHDADVAIVTEILDSQEKWICEYCTENEDHPSGYDCIVAEGSHNWGDRIGKWLKSEGIYFNSALVKYLRERIDTTDCELQYNSNEYACYSGPGLCLDSVEIGEYEHQIDIVDSSELKQLHDQGRLDDILDDVKSDMYISRSRRREFNEKTGHYEPVGRETYDAYPHHAGNPTMFGYVMPGGQWHWVIPAGCIKEMVSEYKLERVPVNVSPDTLENEGYTEIVEQSDGEVVLRNNHGGLEVFAVRESYSGWSIPTDDGRVLEFCRSIR